MGSKTTTNTTSAGQQTVAPPSWALPQMQAIAGGIMNGIGAVQGTPKYTGDFVAHPGALQTAVPQGYMDAAAMARALVPQAQGALTAAGQMPTFSIPNLQPALQTYGSTNPGGMDAAVRAAINPVYKQLTEQILPSLQSSGMESGAYGGSRALVTLPGQALNDFSLNAGNIAAGMNYQDYTDTANRMLQGYGLDTTRGLGVADTLTSRLGLTPELLNSIMRLQGGAAELGAQGATADTANRQSLIDDQLQKYQYQLQQPFMGYDVATDLISKLAGNYGQTNTTGTQTQTQRSGGLAPILGGALGLGMAALSLPTGGGGSLGGSLVSQLFGKKGP